MQLCAACADREVEVDVRFEKLRRGGCRAVSILSRWMPIQPQIFDAGALRCERGKFSLIKPARFDQFVYVRLRTARDCPQQRPGEEFRAFADVCTVAEARLDHTHDFERLQCLAQGGAANSELLSRTAARAESFRREPYVRG